MSDYEIYITNNGNQYRVDVTLTKEGDYEEERYVNHPEDNYLNVYGEPEFEFIFWSEEDDDDYEVEPTSEMIKQAKEICENIYWNTIYD